MTTLPPSWVWAAVIGASILSLITLAYDNLLPFYFFMVFAIGVVIGNWLATPNPQKEKHG